MSSVGINAKLQRLIFLAMRYILFLLQKKLLKYLLYLQQHGEVMTQTVQKHLQNDNK